jgi:uncharacterized protein
VSIDTREKSTYLAAPILLLRFAVGSTVHRFTPADIRATVNVPGIGVETYEPDAIQLGDMDFTNEDGSGSRRISLPRLNPVSTLLMAGLPAVPMSLTIYRFHENDGEVLPEFVGKVVMAAYSGPSVEVTVAPLSVVLKRKIPRFTYQKLCNWTLYSAGCGVSRAAFTDSGTVSSVSSDGVTVQAVVFGTRADGWYESGYLERASDGSRQYVIAHAGEVVTLQRPFFGLQVGEAIKGVAGCRLRETEDCLNKFNNKNRFLGFPRIPIKNPWQQGMG